MFIIGKITGFHGVKGEVKVPYSERLEKNLSLLDEISVYTSQTEYKTLKIEYFKVHKNNVLLKFKEYSNKNDVIHLKGALLKLKEENVAPLEDEEYFIKDIIGLDVYDTDNKLIAKVNSVLTGKAADDILEIKTLNDSIGLVPFVEELVPVVDIKNKKVIINNIPGLLDDEI